MRAAPPAPSPLWTAKQPSSKSCPMMINRAGLPGRSGPLQSLACRCECEGSVIPSADKAAKVAARESAPPELVPALHLANLSLRCVTSLIRRVVGAR